MTALAILRFVSTESPGLDWQPENIVPYLVLGLVVGLMVGLTSIGAGAIATPVLILLLGVPPLLAVGSSIVTGAAIKAFGAIKHRQRGAVDYALVKRLLWGSIPAVGLAVLALYWLRGRDLNLADLWVDRFLGVALVVLGLCVLARDTRWARRWQIGEDHPTVGLRGVVIGVIVGVLFGLTSIGTGSLLVVLLSVFFALSETRVVGTAIVYGFVISLIGSALHIYVGTVNWRLVSLLLAGGFPGAVLGAGLAAHAPRRFLRVCFSLGAIWAGWKLI